MNEDFKDLADLLNTNKEYIPRARRVFNNLNKIESILSTGITLKSLVYIINENGFEIKFDSFKNDIYQARKKLKKLQLENVGTADKTKTQAVIQNLETTKTESGKRKLTISEAAAQELESVKLSSEKNSLIANKQNRT